VPRQNRVTPFGEVIATPERGELMGNRGVLHDARGRIRRDWQVKRWITCLPAFRGRRRAVMTPGHYTELFFLDEATALAAGHRPCAECRRERFNAFRAARSAKRADEIDARLHAERLAADGSKRTFTAALDGLPDGAFVALEGGAFLVRGGALLLWSPAGYTERRPRPAGVGVAVLTPPATVAAIRAGYAPDIHPSAG
jgi:hypothetical protein